MKEGDQFIHEFSISQEQVNQFATLSGDLNPIHTNEEFAAQTPFKKPIVHGIFTASVISKVLGTQFPGEGSIYLSQTLQFMRPVYPGKPYKAVFSILHIDYQKNKATIKTEIFDHETGKIVLDGEAVALNKKVFIQP